jgi:ribosomal-protein-alanine N-acetyltransferase
VSSHACSTASIDDPIETPRLRLISVTEQSLESELAGTTFAHLCGMSVPETWPPSEWDKQAIAYLLGRMRHNPQYRGWCRYIAMRQPDDALPLLIGGCGCTNAPESVPDVEIGYSVLGDFQRRGYVTEAVRAFLPWVFSHPNVQSICAQTYPHLAGSIGVLRKCGFVLDGTGKDPGTILFRLRRLPPDEY